jgi:uncharacterized membrane protein SirB2
VEYTALRTIHECAVALSVSGFFARGVGALRGAAWVRGRAARSMPHLVDTVLLASAVALAWTLRLNPLEVSWLLAKILALLVYIALGMLALKPGRPRPQRAAAFVAALATFAYIVSVAISKDPSGYFGWLLRR